MPEPEETRRALQLITAAAVATASGLITPAAEETRSTLLAATNEIVAYYSDGSSALAADHYDELREAAVARSAYLAEQIAALREETIRIGVLWAVQPLQQLEPDLTLAASRIGEIVQYEVANAFRDTITENTRKDPGARGWQRITSGVGCDFCRMLAGRGAVYRADTSHFASHPGCGCTAAPVFG